jgi:hypothetical protein
MVGRGGRGDVSKRARNPVRRKPRAGTDLPGEAMQVYAAIAEAAATGAPAPDASVLAEIGRRRDARGLLAQLSRAGLIKLERRAGASLSQKRYFVTRTARWTGWLILRDRRVRKAGAARDRAEAGGTAQKLLDHLRWIATMRAPLPAGREIQAALGMAPGTIDGQLRALKRHGLIRVETGPDRRSRRIFVVDVARWTSWSHRAAATHPSHGRPRRGASITPAQMEALYAGRRHEDQPGFERLGRPVLIDPRRNGYVPSASSAALAAL